MLVKQWPNYSTLWPAGPVLRVTFVEYLIVFCGRPEATGDVVSGRTDQDVGTDVCANFGVSRLKPSDVSFSAHFRTSIISNQTYIVRSYPVQLYTRHA